MGRVTRPSANDYGVKVMNELANHIDQIVSPTHEETTPEPEVIDVINPLNLPKPEFAKLGAEAIIKYCEAAAEYIEEVGNNIKSQAESIFAECKATAESMREIGRLEASRTTDVITRMRDAAVAIQEARARFNEQMKITTQ